MADTSLSRTIWAEQHVESFISPSFVAEFVFRSPQVIDGTQKEVADFLIHRADEALLVSQKCQDDTTSRTGEKLERWARKKADEATSQLKGALKRVGVSNEIWCEHPRRGRVSFPDGLPNITHAVATVEVFKPLTLQDELPLDYHRTPISYLTVSDFLNVCNELRTVPEVIRYLDARRSLPESVLLTIGSERLLFSYYLFHDGTFAGFSSLADTQQLLLERSAELSDVLNAKVERDQYAGLLEHVADELAGRHLHYSDGLSQAVLDYYEPTGERRMYLVMQDLIAGLMLGERAELGRAFDGAIQRRTTQGGITGARTARRLAVAGRSSRSRRPARKPCSTVSTASTAKTPMLGSSTSMAHSTARPSMAARTMTERSSSCRRETGTLKASQNGPALNGTAATADLGCSLVAPSQI